MTTLNVKLPEEQKEEVEKMAELKKYPSTSEYVRQALRDQIERDLELSEEVEERLKLLEEGDAKILDSDEVDEELNIK
jgi:Arc/MetJ-type ribon-helix-helix transcriptional regulator